MFEKITTRGLNIQWVIFVTFWICYAMNIHIFYQLLSLDFSCFNSKIAFSFPVPHVCSAIRWMFLRLSFAHSTFPRFSAFTGCFPRCLQWPSCVRIPQHMVFAKQMRYQLWTLYQVRESLVISPFTDNSRNFSAQFHHSNLWITFPPFLEFLAVMLWRRKLQHVHAKLFLRFNTINAPTTTLMPKRLTAGGSKQER